MKNDNLFEYFKKQGTAINNTIATIVAIVLSFLTRFIIFFMIYFLIVVSILLFSAGIAGWIAAPYVPTRKRDVARFLELAEIKAGDVVYDLGCGDGRILSAAAKHGARAIGFELSILNYLFCKIFRRGIKVKFQNFLAPLENNIEMNNNEGMNAIGKIKYWLKNNLNFLMGFKANFSDADLVYMFLSPAAHNKMGEILKKQLKPGARIIVYVWPIDGLVASKINKVAGWPNLYLYRL